MNWDDFAYSARVDHRQLKDLLVQLEAHRLSIQKLHIPPDWAADLRRLNIVRAIHGTTAIEGNPLSEAEVEQTLSSSPNGVERKAERQVRNAQRAHEWVGEQFVRPGRPIRLDDILHIHYLLTAESDEEDNAPGQIRGEGHDVTVGAPDLGGVHRGAPGGQRLHELLVGFVRELESERIMGLHPVQRALWAHFFLVTLHPFGNGNGRTARCVEAAILFQGGYNTHGFFSLSNSFYADREAYIRLLQQSRTELNYDLTEFFRFGLEKFVAELDRITSYIQRRIERLMYRDLIRRCYDRRVGPRRRLLNHREQALLHYLLDETPPASPFTSDPDPSVTIRDLARSAFFNLNYGGVTARTVNREINRLAEFGFVKYQRLSPHDLVIELDFSAITKY